MENCIFCRIISGKTGSGTVYEDEHLVVVRDIAPQAPVHYLIIPRRHIPTLNDFSGDDTMLAGHLLRTAAAIAAREGFADEGYRVAVNCNAAGGQTVWHLHVHLLGGRRMSWPPG